MKFKSSGTSRRTSRQTQGKSLSVHAETCELRTLLTASVTSVGIVDSLELPLDAGDREVTSDTDSTPASCEVVDEPITCIFPDWDGAVADFESVAVEDGDLLGDSGSSEFVDGEGLLLPGTGGLDPIPSWCYPSFVTTTWDGEVSEGEFSEADPADFESVAVEDGDLLGDSGSSEFVDGEGLLLPGTGGLDPIPSWCYRSFVTTMDGETDGEVEVTDEGKDTTHVDFDLSAYYEALFASIFATTWDGEVSEGEFSEADPADFESVAVEDGDLLGDSGSSEFVDGEGLLLPGTGGLDPIPSWCYPSIFATTWDGEVSEGEFSEADPADFESVTVDDGDLLGDSGSSESVDGEGLLLPGTGGLDPIPSWCYRSFVTTMDGETDGEVEVTDEGKDTTHVDFDLSAYYEALFASIFATTWDGEVSEGEFSEADPADFESVAVEDGDLLGDSGSSEFVDGEGLLLPGTGGLDPIPSWCYPSIFATTWDGEVSEGEFSEADPADFESVAVEDQAIFEDLESIADLESGDIWDRSVMFLSANAGGVEVQRSNVSSEVMTATTAASTLAIPVKPQSSTALFSSDRDRSPMSIPAVAQATSVLGSHASLGKRNATLRRLSAQLTATRQIPAAEGLSNLSPILGGDVAPSETESPENSVDSPPVEAGSSEETVSENGSSTAAGFAANQYVQTGSRRAATIDRVMAQYAEHLFNS